MAHSVATRPKKRTLTRRNFLWMTTLSTAGIVTGCAVNPVTGSRQLMLMSESEEIAVDQQQSPQQFSADYGPVQDSSLNNYLTQVGNDLASRSHRPQMPYSFRAVNATYVNAYAFPGGSIAATRGILLEIENEAELAGLMGHEIGHVNARHTASRMTNALLVQGALSLATAGIDQSKYKQWSEVAAVGGTLFATGMLAFYSREDEREADDLGMDYMTRANHSPQGMVGLMDILRSMSSHKPNAIEVMFSTHPMSDERYQTAVNASQSTYSFGQEFPLNRERYMDATASLRRMSGALEEMQTGEGLMMQEQYAQAEGYFNNALRRAPRDYAGLVLMAKCQVAQQRYDQAQQYARIAQQVYPSEGQGYLVGGVASLNRQDFASAYEEFARYDQMLPGNPDIVFYKGYSQEGMQHKQQAAEEYNRYLQIVNEGEQAQHAYGRLVEWGYVNPQQ